MIHLMSYSNLNSRYIKKLILNDTLQTFPMGRGAWQATGHGAQELDIL